MKVIQKQKIQMEIILKSLRKKLQAWNIKQYLKNGNQVVKQILLKRKLLIKI